MQEPNEEPKKCKFCNSTNVEEFSTTNAFRKFMEAIACKDCGKVTTF